MIRVVLVDDQPLLRAGFRALIEAEDDIVVVGGASDGRGALDVIVAQKPDVVLMDIRMPELDGLEATRILMSNPALKGVHVVILTTFDLDEYVLRRSASALAASSSRTPNRPSCWPAFARWRSATRCCRPASPDG